MFRPIDIAVGAALAVGLMFAFADPLVAMVHQWDASPMYSYGYTVPLISTFLLWSRRDEFRRRPLRPARLPGALVLALSLALLVVGQVGAIQVVQQVAFVIAIVAIVLFLFGVDYLAVSAPAIAYLLFMVPLWDAFTEPLHWPFQNTSAQIGVAIMQAIGIPVHREGTFIALPNVLLEVARECSGINYLVAVLALALPLAFLRLRQTWRRVLLVVSALAIAALANGLRVALIGTLLYYEVGSPLHGPFHVLHGLFVAGIGYVVLFVGLRLLETDQPSISAPIVKPDGSAAAPPDRWRLLDACGLAVAFWTLVFVGVAPDARPIALAQPLEALPQRLGAWSIDTIGPVGAAADRATALSAWSGADDHLRRLYSRADGQRATVDIWYFKVQGQGREIVDWRVSDLRRLATRKAITLPIGGTLEANVIRWPNTQQVGLFWYDLDGSTEADPYATMLRSLWNVISAGRSNGAVIMLSASPSSLSDAQAETALVDLAVELQPALAGVLPSGRGSADRDQP